MKYIKESVLEFKKVVFPKPNELKRDTIRVIVSMAIASVFLYGIGTGMMFLFSKTF